MDRAVDRLDGVEEEFPNRPIVLKSTAAAAVVKDFHKDRVVAVALDTAIDNARCQIYRIVPRCWYLLGGAVDEGMG